MRNQNLDAGTEEVNVLAYQEGNAWVAQCVEYDIYARAENLPKLHAAFDRALAANACVNAELGRPGLAGIPPAPERFRHAFAAAKHTLVENVQSLQPSSGVKIGEMKVVESV